MAAPEHTPPKPTAYRPAAIALTVLATLAIVALGVIAGRWQYGRYEARAEAVRAFEAAAMQPVVPLEALVAADASHIDSAQWRIVSATGEFDGSSVTALRGRSVDGVPALHHLAWFITPQGPILVDVGWSPRDSGITPALPRGEVDIEGVLRTQEADDARRGDGATRIVAAQMPLPDAGVPLPGYVMLREPCTDEGCVGTAVQPAPLPQLSLGPHLSYAYQWWLLAALAPFAAVYLARRDARMELEAHGKAGELEAAPREPARPRPRPRKQPTDEEIEDAL